MEYDYFDTEVKKIRNKDKDGYESARLWRYLAMLTEPNHKQKKNARRQNRAFLKYGSTHHSSNSSNQLCTVKCSYVPNSVSKHKYFFRKYMTQKGKIDVDGEAVLFNAKEDEASVEAINEYEREMSGKFFRWIVSPGNQGMPMNIMVRNLMKKVEQATGYRLSWFAAKHTDTNRVHCHILINGYDKSGKEVYFDSEFISNTLRRIAGETCTEIMGPRTELEIEADRKKMPLVRKFCRIDSSIKQFENELNMSNYDTEISDLIEKHNYGTSVIAQNDTMLQRLNFLAELGFAKKLKRGNKFLLERGWDDKLRTLGRYNCFYEARKLLKFCFPVNFVEYKSDMGRISGVITSVFKRDFEESWSNAIIVEDIDRGKAYFVPVRDKPDAGLVGKKIEWQTLKGSKGKQSIRENLRVLS